MGFQPALNRRRLGRAYQRLLDAAEAVAAAEDRLAPSPGEWDAPQLLAHLVSVDACILAAAWSVVAGEQASFDNRVTLDTWNLARIAGRIGDEAQLRQRIRLQGQILCALAEQLSDEELGQTVPSLLLSGQTLVVDAPLTLGDLIAGLADDHLPRHTQQLLALLPQVPLPSV